MSGKSHPHSCVSRLAEEGRFAIVMKRRAGDATGALLRSRVSKARADERSEATAKWCGPGLPTLRPSRW
ncbi:hypothetical protein BRAO285_2650031 [Bradyrhizobium sp. ORS 285]|nr:hypothetical protein BRAO285_2650031 [Bradyrhizobium sp. ORS 285]